MTSTVPKLVFHRYENNEESGITHSNTPQHIQPERRQFDQFGRWLEGSCQQGLGGMAMSWKVRCPIS